MESGGNFFHKQAHIALVMGDGFKRCGFYNSGMDRLVYLEEDCSYRTKYSRSSNIILCLHPQEDRVIGIQIQGFSEVKFAQCLPQMPAFLRMQYRWYLAYRRKLRICRYYWREFKRHYAPST